MLFRMVDDVTRAMSKGSACECPRGGACQFLGGGDDVTWAMSGGGAGGACECLHTPPSGNPVSAPDDASGRYGHLR